MVKFYTFIVAASLSVCGVAVGDVDGRALCHRCDRILAQHSVCDGERAWAVVLKDGKPLAFGQYGCKDGHPTACEFTFEPGSVIKPFVAATALEKKVIQSLDAEYRTDVIEEGYGMIPEDRCHNWPVKMSVRDGLAKSSNVVFGKLGYDVGPHRLCDGLRRFGFGGDAGFLEDPNRWTDVMRSRAGVGQSMLVTPMQLAKAYAILANGGVGFDVKSNRVVSSEVATSVCSSLEGIGISLSDADIEGVARKSGVRVAGMTGTAQRVVDGHYAKGLYNASYVGFFKWKDSQYVIAVVFECGRRNRHRGREVSMPVFNEIVDVITGGK